MEVCRGRPWDKTPRRVGFRAIWNKSQSMALLWVSTRRRKSESSFLWVKLGRPSIRSGWRRRGSRRPTSSSRTGSTSRTVHRTHHAAFLRSNSQKCISKVAQEAHQEIFWRIIWIKENSAPKKGNHSKRRRASLVKMVPQQTRRKRRRQNQIRQWRRMSSRFLPSSLSWTTNCPLWRWSSQLLNYWGQ